MIMDLAKTLSDEPECKGKIYRARVNAYIDSKGTYVYQERMVPMKRLSCPGCQLCDYLVEDIQDFIDSDVLPIIENIEDGALYELCAVNQTRDWETGIIDDWDLEFRKIERGQLSRPQGHEVFPRQTDKDCE